MYKLNVKMQQCHMVFVVLSVVTALSRTTEAKWSDKFAFPSHLIGTNHSYSSDLEVYREKYNPIDLGVDNLDDEGPMFIRRALANATTSDDASVNQYSSGDGLERLRRAIATLYSKLINRKLNWKKNVMVTVGASEALYSTIVGHTSEGDEWLIIQPAYDSFVPIVRQARGVPKFVSLKLRKRNDGGEQYWQIDRKQFEKSLSKRTKGIILNNPVNPIGKSLSLDELHFIGDMAKKYNILIVSDEAHEWLTFSKPHIRIASLSGLYERTITIGSASKSFGLAGWRIGWAYGPENLLRNAMTVHSTVVSSNVTPQQHAIADGFEREIRCLGSSSGGSYFESNRKHVETLRDSMVRAFVEAGLKTMKPDSGNCVFVDWSPIRRKLPQLRSSVDFCVWLIKNVGVLGLPGNAYYEEDSENLANDFARFCYHKKRETIEEASRRLKKLKRYLN